MTSTLTFTERRKQMEQVSKDITTVASQLSQIACVLADEASRMAVAEQRFAGRSDLRRQTGRRAVATSAKKDYDRPTQS